MDGKEAVEEWQSKVLDLTNVEGAFFFQEGFSRPDWKLIRQTIQKTISRESHGDAWTDAANQWAQQLRNDLGGLYHVRRSQEFILLCDLDSAAAHKFLAFAEQTLERIYSTLKDAAWQWGHGKHVILLFSEEDDYYQYVSFFHQEGVHPKSGGCLIHRDYVHIAMPYGDGNYIRRALTHELAHNSVVHLRLPLWLNEGLAILFERAVADSHRPFLDHDLRDRHLAFWNPDNIQKFWSGVSFHEPGDSNELSYNLAEVVVNLLLSHQGAEFGGFVKEARWDDAGQTAALDYIGVGLGTVMGTFLGEGSWRPQRKAMLQCWKEATKQKAKAPSDDRNHSAASSSHADNPPFAVWGRTEEGG